MKEKSANNVVDCSNGSLRFAVLRRSVRTGETNFNTGRVEISEKRMVVKFASIITLKRLNVSFKLVFDIHSEIAKHRKNFRFGT